LSGELENFGKQIEPHMTQMMAPSDSPKGGGCVGFKLFWKKTKTI